MQTSEFVWMDGQLVPWNQATVHVASHVIHYGSSVFEGIRVYGLPKGPAVLCLGEHLDRFWDSARIFRMEIPHSKDELRQAVLETVRVNKHKACYIRPVVFRGVGTIGLDGRSCITHTSVFTLEMGKYLGEEAFELGVDVTVSTWNRIAPNTCPAAAKIGGQYVNSQLVVMEAIDRGFNEGIALDTNGYVSEGSGENIFFVRRGEILTPPLANSILEGITRRCVLTLAAEQGLTVKEEVIPRELLYLADEIFFCGTAAEVTPVRSVDGVVVGAGRRGPVTSQISKAFFDIVEGKVPDRHHWLTPVGD